MAAEPKAPRDPSELVTKGIDPQLEMADILLQGRALGMLERSVEPSPAVPAARPPAPAEGKARS